MHVDNAAHYIKVDCYAMCSYTIKHVLMCTLLIVAGNNPFTTAFQHFSQVCNRHEHNVISNYTLI